MSRSHRAHRATFICVLAAAGMLAVAASSLAEPTPQPPAGASSLLPAASPKPPQPQVSPAEPENPQDAAEDAAEDSAADAAEDSAEGAAEDSAEGVAASMARTARMAKAEGMADSAAGEAEQQQAAVSSTPATEAPVPSPGQEPPPEPQLAARPALTLPTTPLAATQDTPLLQLPFEAGSAELGSDAEARLTDVAEGMKANEKQRLEIAAYAGGDDLSTSSARRLSLLRALAVRAYLMQNGIDGTRMYVRALGDTTEDEPANRVDVRVVSR